MKKQKPKVEVFFDYDELKKSQPCSKGGWAFRQIFGTDKPFTGSKEDIRKYTDLRLTQNDIGNHRNTLYTVGADFSVTYRYYKSLAWEMKLEDGDHVISFEVESIDAFVDSVYEWLQTIPFTLLTERKQDGKFTAVA